ncbi:hypothetical protein, partial [Rhodanobacter denitrificans]|uniref:hypothetical protein n=1 Tax=Rhodanobacter denitrificans TaxID=666685 RepID=UPI001EE67E63
PIETEIADKVGTTPSGIPRTVIMKENIRSKIILVIIPTIRPVRKFAAARDMFFRLFAAVVSALN